MLLPLCTRSCVRVGSSVASAVGRWERLLKGAGSGGLEGSRVLGLCSTPLTDWNISSTFLRWRRDPVCLGLGCTVEAGLRRALGLLLLCNKLRAVSRACGGVCFEVSDAVRLHLRRCLGNQTEQEDPTSQSQAAGGSEFECCLILVCCWGTIAALGHGHLERVLKCVHWAEVRQGLGG